MPTEGARTGALVDGVEREAGFRYVALWNGQAERAADMDELSGQFRVLAHGYGTRLWLMLSPSAMFARLRVAVSTAFP